MFFRSIMAFVLIALPALAFAGNGPRVHVEICVATAGALSTDVSYDCDEGHLLDQLVRNNGQCFAQFVDSAKAIRAEIADRVRKESQDMPSGVSIEVRLAYQQYHTSFEPGSEFLPDDMGSLHYAELRIVKRHRLWWDSTIGVQRVAQDEARYTTSRENGSPACSISAADVDQIATAVTGINKIYRDYR